MIYNSSTILSDTVDVSDSIIDSPELSASTTDSTKLVVSAISSITDDVAATIVDITISVVDNSSATLPTLLLPPNNHPNMLNILKKDHSKIFIGLLKILL